MITWTRGTGILLLVGAVAVVAPSYAAAQPPMPASGAVLYVMTENLSLSASEGTAAGHLSAARRGPPWDAALPGDRGEHCGILRHQRDGLG